MFLLDTVVLSEMRKLRPSAKLLDWLGRQSDADLFLSVVTLGEIERGIDKQRKFNAEFAAELTHWLATTQSLYADRILPVSAPIARRWGALSAQLGHEGADLLIAATAVHHGLTVVTRNVKHFTPAGAKVFDPFAG